ncbi:MAG: hypothetical protein IKR49_07595 [Clostridia bacterium]|nr:hypothetical protein [Clostridia bacterium]
MLTPKEYAAALRSLWCDRCTVTIKRKTETPGGRTVQTNETLFANVPCRLSFKSIEVTEESSSAACTVQATVLLLDRQYSVPAGSIITVQHEGMTGEYERSGIPAVYSVHQEIPLKLRKEWT